MLAAPRRINSTRHEPRVPSYQEWQSSVPRYLGEVTLPASTERDCAQGDANPTVMLALSYSTLENGSDLQHRPLAEPTLQ